MEKAAGCPEGAHREFAATEAGLLFRHFRASLLRFFERRVASSMDAEDLTQEVFVKISSLDDTARIRQPEAYLFQTAANVLRDKLRRDAARCRQDHVSFDDTVDGPEAPSGESVYEGEESLLRLFSALDQLTPKCRAVFLMHKYERLAYSEIAQHFGISVSAVEKHMISAIKHLKQHWRDVS